MGMITATAIEHLLTDYLRRAEIAAVAAWAWFYVPAARSARRNGKLIGAGLVRAAFSREC